ncbi:MAG: Asp-tRNA(Asn)/Glu-tRNA(Gln) amidotransferase GatCAB subunit A [Bryobacterales bacterium]|nr:Asp-tRNA(Asn)/Glu-tRNA(Gln) amidotransferase GatCAB subunit A [Bryobacterales bacterium]
MAFESIRELASALRARKISAVELAERALAAAERLQPALNAFVTLTPEIALAQARRADQELRAGRDRGPLHGIPVGHKDLFCTKGVRTTCGSKIWREFVPDYNATVVQRLEDAGMVLIGKTGLHECAYGITSTNPHFGAVRNPWDTERIPGGSSGGSGAAVAAGILPMATGTDTGGSIRIPASFCGIVGLKPTFGRVSKYGVIDLAYTLDHIGPMTRNVRDAALCLDVMAGHDPLDPYSSTRPVEPFLPPGSLDLKSVRLGVPDAYFFERLDPEVEAAVRRVCSLAERLGAAVEELTLPDMAAVTATALTIQLPEAAAVHEPHKERAADYGADVWANLERGRAISTGEYVNAQHAMRRYRREFCAAFADYDALIVPATPTPAPKIGQTTLDISGETVNTRMATTSLVRAINALGLPALALPCGLSASGLPLSCQIVGHAWEGAMVLRIAAALEDARGALPVPPVRVGEPAASGGLVA